MTTTKQLAEKVFSIENDFDKMYHINATFEGLDLYIISDILAITNMFSSQNARYEFILKFYTMLPKINNKVVWNVPFAPALISAFNIDQQKCNIIEKFMFSSGARDKKESVAQYMSLNNDNICEIIDGITDDKIKQKIILLATTHSCLIFSMNMLDILLSRINSDIIKYELIIFAIKGNANHSNLYIDSRFCVHYMKCLSDDSKIKLLKYLTDNHYITLTIDNISMFIEEFTDKLKFASAVISNYYSIMTDNMLESIKKLYPTTEKFTERLGCTIPYIDNVYRTNIAKMNALKSCFDTDEKYFTYLQRIYNTKFANEVYFAEKQRINRHVLVKIGENIIRTDISTIGYCTLTTIGYCTLTNITSTYKIGYDMQVNIDDDIEIKVTYINKKSKTFKLNNIKYSDITATNWLDIDFSCSNGDIKYKLHDWPEYAIAQFATTPYI